MGFILIFCKIADGDEDCPDGSDESNCQNNRTVSATCKPDEFRCKESGQCIPQAWRCDNDKDCNDESDEKNCEKKECDPWMFSCGDGRCIYNTWRCGEYK